MNGRNLAELALKVWGVILILGAILLAPAALWMVWKIPTGDPEGAAMYAGQVAYVINLVVQALGGFVILVWADRIASSFESDGTPLQIDVSAAHLQVLAFAILGVIIVVDGLQNAAGAGYALLTKPDQADTASYMWALQGDGMIKAAVQIAAGAFLVFGRESLVRGWLRLRRPQSQDSADPADAK